MGIVMREPRRNRKLSKPGSLELLRLVIWLSGLMEAYNIICAFIALELVRQSLGSNWMADKLFVNVIIPRAPCFQHKTPCAAATILLGTVPVNYR